ncbi:MAG: NfeD family protein, partial [Chloroflexota bacterium]
TISAFMSMFGAIGMVGTLSGRSLWLIVLVGVILSYAMARVVAEVMKYVYRQQGNSDYSISELIGKTATATINSESGKTGEVMIEAGRLIKYPVREINGEPLKRGDSVIVREIDGRYLKVEKVGA